MFLTTFSAFAGCKVGNYLVWHLMELCILGNLASLSMIDRVHLSSENVKGPFYSALPLTRSFLRVWMVSSSFLLLWGLASVFLYHLSFSERVQSWQMMLLWDWRRAKDVSSILESKQWWIGRPSAKGNRAHPFSEVFSCAPPPHPTPTSSAWHFSNFLPTCKQYQNRQDFILTSNSYSPTRKTYCDNFILRFFSALLRVVQIGQNKHRLRDKQI